MVILFALWFEAIVSPFALLGLPIELTEPEFGSGIFSNNLQNTQCILNSSVLTNLAIVNGLLHIEHLNLIFNFNF